jgi:RNA polymerase sigma-70 factor, ECF subfamily
VTNSGTGQLQDELGKLVPNLRAFARSLSGNADQADDLVQETLVKAWKHRSSFEPGTNLKAWLFTILRNAYLSERRKRKLEVEDKDGAYAAQVSIPGSQSSHMDLVDFAKALELLPVDQKEALLLIGAEGFSYEEAGAMCGCAVGTIKSRVNRARARLAEMLQVEGASDYGPDQHPSAGQARQM